MYFFCKDTATTEIYPLSLHDALPISLGTGHRQTQATRLVSGRRHDEQPGGRFRLLPNLVETHLAQDAQHGAHRVKSAESLRDRKSTRLNSSHANISYAVFCLKKKTQI